MNEVVRLFQAFLAPAIFVSATSLLILSINVRLMGMVTRLRHFVHARYDASSGNRLQEAEAYDTQIESIAKRRDDSAQFYVLTDFSCGHDHLMFAAWAGTVLHGRRISGGDCIRCGFDLPSDWRFVLSVGSNGRVKLRAR